MVRVKTTVRSTRESSSDSGSGPTNSRNYNLSKKRARVQNTSNSNRKPRNQKNSLKPNNQSTLDSSCQLSHSGRTGRLTQPQKTAAAKQRRGENTPSVSVQNNKGNRLSSSSRSLVSFEDGRRPSTNHFRSKTRVMKVTGNQCKHWKPLSNPSRCFMRKATASCVHMTLSAVTDDKSRQFLMNLQDRLLSFLPSLKAPPNRIGNYQDLPAIIKQLKAERRKNESKMDSLGRTYFRLEKSLNKLEKEKRLMLESSNRRPSRTVEVPDFLEEYEPRLNLPNI